jgi:hypothetical protein
VDLGSLASKLTVSMSTELFLVNFKRDINKFRSINKVTPHQNCSKPAEKAVKRASK